MIEPARNPIQSLPLTPSVFNILMALADGEKHGFAIILKVESNTNRQVQLGPGTLFGSIKRMLKANLIEQSDERADPDLDDQRRRYYRITGLGQRILQMEIKRQASQVAVAQAKDLLGSALVGGEG